MVFNKIISQRRIVITTKVVTSLELCNLQTSQKHSVSHIQLLPDKPFPIHKTARGHPCRFGAASLRHKFYEWERAHLARWMFFGKVWSLVWLSFLFSKLTNIISNTQLLLRRIVIPLKKGTSLEPCNLQISQKHSVSNIQLPFRKLLMQCRTKSVTNVKVAKLYWSMSCFYEDPNRVENDVSSLGRRVLNE